MTRVIKQRMVRKQELVDMAESLFEERGYEHTTVHDIVKRLYVVQGTFYYYFHTKSDILDAVVEKHFLPLEEELQNLLSRKSIQPTEIIREIVWILLHYHSQNILFFKSIQKAGNAGIKSRLIHAFLTRITPILAETFADGKAKGCLSILHPYEAAEFLLSALSLWNRPYENGEDAERIQRIQDTLQQMLERGCGLNAGALRLK
jgi:AcrR family transcriptional regulator